jgi:hypothetical protein
MLFWRLNASSPQIGASQADAMRATSWAATDLEYDAASMSSQVDRGRMGASPL